MSEVQEKQQIKKQIIDEQMKQFWDFCGNAMKSYQRDEDGPVIPQSLQEFSELFLNKLTNMVEAI
jgi:hypothetical protein